MRQDDGAQTDDQQFLDGILDVQTGNGTSIVRARIVNYATHEGFQVDDEVTINVPNCGGGVSGTACLGGVVSGRAILSDDDLKDLAIFAAGTWGCDDSHAQPGTALSPPDLSALKSRYNPAYIEPVHDSAASGVGGLPTFLRNQGFDPLHYGSALWSQALPPVRTLPVSTPSFWTVMVLASWQEKESTDFDPDSEAAEGTGIVWGINTHADGATTPPLLLGSAYTGMCAVFRAVVGEVEGREQFTVAHEVGHTLGLPHNVFTQFDAEGVGVPIDLMDPTGAGHFLPFKAENLMRLRSYVGP